jgi:ubiquitin-like 1-activating enzyme E1 B
MAHVAGVFDTSLTKSITDSKILMVGAGGIGCELLKNIVLTGFKDIEIIDLDTIDVSNLNRQFLFQKQHVGKSKSAVARESALRFAPDAKIKAYHDSIMKEEYGISFYKQFNLCLNALDNRAARSHVNRMCLAANIPLVESGTAGYLGQVTVIRKGITECYECQPKPHQKTFPGCTIRNTPSEPIHCIVWAKHLFNQLFGEDDPDQDVSPDTEDPEASGDTAGEAAANKEANEAGNVTRKSTKQWAQECDYSTQKLFQKLFNDDIKYLLSMDKLWAKRRPPTPLDWDCLPDTTNETVVDSNLADQKVWSVAECVNFLQKAITDLKQELKGRDDGELVWDKDTPAHLDFVTACANIRMYIFNIQQKSRFEVKSMAGNIIPAIATTNAVIAGCIVMEAIKILNCQFDKCRTVYLRQQPNPRKKILVTEQLEPPNPKCYVCAEKPEVNVMLNVETTTIKFMEEKILKGALNMVAPDVEVEGKGVILISSEEGETEANNEKFLKDFGLKDGSILTCDDFLQNYQLKMILFHADKMEDGQEFIVTGDKSQLQPKEEEPAVEAEPEKETGNKDSAIHVAENDDVEVVSNGDRKRPAGDDTNGVHKAKKQKVDDDDDDVVICEVEENGKAATPVKKASPPPAEDGVICIE